MSVRVTQTYLEVIRSTDLAPSGVSGDIDFNDDDDSINFYGVGIYIGNLTLLDDDDISLIKEYNNGILVLNDDDDNLYAGIISGLFSLSESDDVVTLTQIKRHYVNVAVISEDQ